MLESDCKNMAALLYIFWLYFVYIYVYIGYILGKNKNKILFTCGKFTTKSQLLDIFKHLHVSNFLNNAKFG